MSWVLPRHLPCMIRGETTEVILKLIVVLLALLCNPVMAKKARHTVKNKTCPCPQSNSDKVKTTQSALKRNKGKGQKGEEIIYLLGIPVPVDKKVYNSIK